MPDPSPAHLNRIFGRSDPTRPLPERTPDELGAFVDDHLVMALSAADLLHGHRQYAEDYLRDRLVALSDEFRDANRLAAEGDRRRVARLADALLFARSDARQ